MARRSRAQLLRRRFVLGAAVVAGLGLIQLAVHGRRSGRFAAALPILPADHRVVLVATLDGQHPGLGHWSAPAVPEVERADTPELVWHGEELLLYSLSADTDRIHVKAVGDAGLGDPIDLGGACAGEWICVDPALLRTEVPRPGLRLFVVQATRGADPAVAGQTRVLSAHSTDGRRFVLDTEPALDLPNRVDPDPVRLADGRLRLYTSRLLRGGAGAELVVESAAGAEGGALDPEPGVRIAEASATSSARVGSDVITFFHDISGRLRRARSVDGLSFVVDPAPVELGLDGDHRYLGLEAPSLVQGPDGWRLALSTVVEPWWPWNEVAARAVEREVEWEP